MVKAFKDVFIFFSRVVAPGKGATVGGYKFQNFGAHSDHYPCAYLTAAAAIGMTKADVDIFISRLEKVLAKTKAPKNGSSGDNPDDVEIGECVEVNASKQSHASRVEGDSQE